MHRMAHQPNDPWYRVAAGEMPVVCGHRGTPAHELENTIAGFRRAQELGATAIEFDIRPAADGKFVVHHDPVTADGVVIAATDTCDLVSRMPTFEELVATCSDMFLDIELKTDDTACTATDYVAAAINAIDELCRHRLSSVIVTSFDAVVLAGIAESDLQVATGLLYHETSHEWARQTALEAGHHCVAPWIELVDQRSVGQAHDVGLGVLTWTVNSADQIARALSSGVDVVIGDDPVPLVAAVADAHRR